MKAFDGLTDPINRYLPKQRTAEEAAGDRDLPRRPGVELRGALEPVRALLRRERVRRRRAEHPRVDRLRPRVRDGGQPREARRLAEGSRDGQRVGEGAAVVRSTSVVMWGQSYGGYTMLMALTRQPALWRAGVDYVRRGRPEDVLADHRRGHSRVFVTEFGDLDKDARAPRQVQPDARHRARSTRRSSCTRPERSARAALRVGAVVKALRARNVPVEYMVAANEGHTVRSARDEDRAPHAHRALPRGRSEDRARRAAGASPLT